MRAKKKVNRLEESNRFYKKEYRKATKYIQSLEDKNDHLEETIERINRIPQPSIKKHWVIRFVNWFGRKAWKFLEGPK